MLKIHTSDGRTIPIDLADEEQARFWLERLSKSSFQSQIKAVSLVERHTVGRCKECGHPSDRSVGVQYSIPRPDGFGDIFFNAENVEPNGKIKGGERIILFAGDIRLVLMAHRSQPATRVTITRIGKQRYNPLKGGRKK